MTVFMQRLSKLRSEKMNLGALMRIVRSQKYEKLSDSLAELNDVERLVPELLNYHEFFGEKRDQSAEKRGKLGPQLNYSLTISGGNRYNQQDELVDRSPQ